MKKILVQKINFSKIEALWAGVYKKKIDKPGQMLWSRFSVISVVYNNI